MQKGNYTLPLRFDQIISKRRHDKCSYTDSIAQNLHLIISTYRGESAYDPEYGCSIWDEEFLYQLSIRWKDDVRQSVINAITKAEKRLKLDDVKVELVDHESRNNSGIRVRRKLIITVTGVIKKTAETFSFRKSLFISPLSQV